MNFKESISVIESYSVNREIFSFINEKMCKKKSEEGVSIALNNAIMSDDKNSFLLKMEEVGFSNKVAEKLYDLLNVKTENVDELVQMFLCDLERNVSKNVLKYRYIIYFLYYQGEFVLANRFQIKVIKETARIDHKRVPLIWKIWGSYLNGDSDATEYNIDALGYAYRIENNKRKVDLFSRILRGKKEIIDNNLDCEFGDRIRGKRVSIIGPAATDINFDNIYANTDVVIFITYKDDSVYAIDRTYDIFYVSYYNMEALRNIDECGMKAINELDFVCTKRTSKINFGNVKHRKALLLDGMYFNGIPHMLQNIVFDVFRYNPIDIKTYGFNLYLNNIQYRDNYTKTKKTRTQWTKDFAVHNIATQYIMLKIMMDKDIFIPDNQLTVILNMGIDKYLKKMEEIYVNTDK